VLSIYTYANRNSVCVAMAIMTFTGLISQSNDNIFFTSVNFSDFFKDLWLIEQQHIKI
jgi:uncharacterized protein YkvS